MFHRIKTAFAIVAAAGLAVAVMAQVAPQTTRDYAENNRLIIDGKPLFISGMNIAWNDFGNDVGDTPVDVFAFTQYVQGVRAAGGNAVRWWLHTDGGNCPKFGADGKVSGVGSHTINNIKTVLDIAHENGVVVALCLFSFDMLVSGDGKGDTWAKGYNIENNVKLLTDSDNLDAYLDNALKPILLGVGNHPAIMCWEAFNEPEGMLQAEGWGHVTRKVPFSDILRVTNKIAGTVHRNSLKMASTGAKDFTYLKPNNARGYYTDSTLKTAGGDEDGWLDFYMAHYYPEWQGTAMSPFHNNASSWGADKPIVIGEFPGYPWPYRGGSIQQGTAMTLIDAFEYAYENGYAGAMNWAMTDNLDNAPTTLSETADALKNLYDKYKDAIWIKDVDIEDLTGDLVMRLKLTNLAPGEDDWSSLALDKVMGFPAGGNVTFEIFIPSGSPAGLEYMFIVQAGSSWQWAQTEPRQFSDIEQGKWVTVSIPVSDIVPIPSDAYLDLSNVRRITLRYRSVGAPYTGTIYFDNFKAGSSVISDFDDSKAWNISCVAGETWIVTKASVGGVSVRHGKAAGKAGLAPTVSVKGKILSVKGINNSEMSVRLLDMRGKTVARFKAANSAQFSLAKIPAGRYIVETRAANKRVGSTAVIVK